MVGLGFGPPEISQDFAVDGTFNYKLHYPTYAVINTLLSVLNPHPRQASYCNFMFILEVCL